MPIMKPSSNLPAIKYVNFRSINCKLIATITNMLHLIIALASPYLLANELYMNGPESATKYQLSSQN